MMKIQGIAPTHVRFSALSLCQKRFFQDYQGVGAYHNASKQAMGKSLQKQLNWKPGLLHWVAPLARQISDKLDELGLDIKIVPDGGDMAGEPSADTYILVMGRKGTLKEAEYNPWQSGGTQIKYVEARTPRELLLEIPFAVARHFQKADEKGQRA